MSVNQVNGLGYDAYNVGDTKGSSSLDKDAFLNLLITQLRHQDPLNPMEDREFIAQTAQFSALEQMTNINKNFTQFMQMQAISNAAALIGKEVSYLTINEETGEVETLSGKVTQVKFAEGSAFLTINDEDIPIELMVSVKEATPSEPEGENGD